MNLRVGEERNEIRREIFRELSVSKRVRAEITLRDLRVSFRTRYMERDRDTQRSVCLE